MRAGPGRGAPGGPGTQDSTGARSARTGADGLPLRVRPSHRPGSGDIAAHDRVILSDHDLAAGEAGWRDANDGEPVPGDASTR